jgi:hypothetical protein
MDTLLVIIVGWIVLSIPVSLLIGRFLAGNRRAAEASDTGTSAAQSESPTVTILQRSEPQLEPAYSEMLQVSEG